MPPGERRETVCTATDPHSIKTAFFDSPYNLSYCDFRDDMLGMFTRFQQKHICRLYMANRDNSFREVTDEGIDHTISRDSIVWVEICSWHRYNFSVLPFVQAMKTTLCHGVRLSLNCSRPALLQIGRIQILLADDRCAVNGILAAPKIPTPQGNCSSAPAYQAIFQRYVFMFVQRFE